MMTLDPADRIRLLEELLGALERDEHRHYARDRVEERVFVEMGCIDLGGEAGG